MISKLIYNCKQNQMEKKNLKLMIAYFHALEDS